MRLNRRLNSVRGGNSRAAATESSHLIPPTPYKSMFYHVCTGGDALFSEQVWEFVLPSRRTRFYDVRWQTNTTNTWDDTKNWRHNHKLSHHLLINHLLKEMRCAKGFTWRHRLHFHCCGQQQWNTTFWLLFIYLKHSTRTVKLLSSQYFRINSSGHSGQFSWNFL